MNFKTITRRQFWSLALLVGLVFAILVSLTLVRQRQEIRKKAAGTSVALSLYPTSETFTLPENKTFEVKVTFTGGSATEKVDYFRTEIAFDKTILKVPENSYIDTSNSGFGKIFRVDGPTAANDSGKIIVELGALSPGAGPSTDKPFTLARITFQAKAPTTTSQTISFNDSMTQVVNNQSATLTSSSQSSHYTVVSTGGLTPTISVPISPPSGRSVYTIDVGDKQSLVFQIGAAVASQIKFKAKLASLVNFPDLYLRLRVKDELAFMNSQSVASVSDDTCNNPPPGSADFYIPMKATDGVYAPVIQISTPAPLGATVVTVTPDGWVVLDGIAPGKYYSLYLKGPKTRGSKMVEHFLLQSNQAQTQEFDWTGKPLDPGDLPNPDRDMKQDCTINATDWSLVKKYIGANKTDVKALDVADVNYDGLVNALDAINILSTLAKKADDD